MDKVQMRERVRELLLPELKTGKMDWWYVSVANKVFQGGYLLQARGPTESWSLMIALGWIPEGCSTETTGPVSEEVLAKIPEEQLWRRLSRDEAVNLGK